MPVDRLETEELEDRFAGDYQRGDNALVAFGCETEKALQVWVHGLEFVHYQSLRRWKCARCQLTDHSLSHLSINQRSYITAQSSQLLLCPRPLSATSIRPTTT